MTEKVMTKTEIMKLIAANRIHESFDHSVEGLFDITEMRQRAKGTVPFTVPIHSVLSFILTDRVFEMQRVFDLDEDSWKNDPAMCVVYDRGGFTEHLLVDGIHRIMRRHHEGLEDFQCYLVNEKDIIRPDMSKWQQGVERGFDWGSEVVVDGKIVKRSEQ